MDFKTFVDTFKTMTCIVSVEKFPDGSYGNIRIVEGNKAYIDSIENMPDGPQMLSKKFVPNSDYQNYFPKDLNFEDFCYRCAILKEPLHTYVHPDRFDFWFNIIMMPLESDKENIGYCTYSQEFSKEMESTKMANMSQDVAVDVLNTCIKLRESTDFKVTMAQILKDIRELCNANYCLLLLMDYSDRTCSILTENIELIPGKVSAMPWFNNDFFDLAETWTETIAGSNCLIIKNKKDMEFVRERNPVWYKSLKEAKIEKIALFPLKKGNDLLGYIWVTEFDVADSVRIKSTLELTTYFLASEIHNHQLFERLRLMSTMDMLTGVYNRNEMNNRVDKLVADDDDSKTSLGILFADLNGLKQINDTEGHAAGDTLLKNAAAMLKTVFVGGDIFRAGGDEFLIMLRDTTEEAVDKLVDQLKKQAKASGSVSFAIGACFEEDSRNVRHAMKMADERMYEDKVLYYGGSPERVRR
ncbi:MAG: GGDEF domain-containing protein [Spirochaetaceae bacterium]|nr:GGDEF domain-containing protein [Spirochaetaceae bacterium]